MDNERPISPFTDWSSLEEIPTRLDLEVEEAEVISITSNSDNDYVPHSPIYEPNSPVEDHPQPENSRDNGAPNIPTSPRRFPISQTLPGKNLSETVRFPISQTLSEESFPEQYSVIYLLTLEKGLQIPSLPGPELLEEEGVYLFKKLPPSLGVLDKGDTSWEE